MSSTQWNTKRARELLIIFSGLLAYCVIALLTNMPCPIHWITGISCPGCGMTRGLLHLLRLDFSGAAYYHPMVFYLVIAIPVLVILYLRNLEKPRIVLLYVSAFVMVAIYLYRMIILRSPVLEFAPQNGILPRLFVWIRTLFS